MRLHLLTLTGILALAGLTAPALAHHAFSAEYDANNVKELDGVVTRFEWTNPHVLFYIDVTDENGDVTNWDLELRSANTLTRAGWTRHALSVGDVVTVDAYMARDGSDRGNARGNLRLADGRLLFAGDPTGQ